MTLYAKLNIAQNAIEQVIPQNTPFDNISFGLNSTDADYASAGLFKIIDVLPTPLEFQTYSNTTLTIDNGLSTVTRTKVFIDLSLSDAKIDLKSRIKNKFETLLTNGFVTTSTIKMDLDTTLLKRGYDLAVSLSETTMDIRDFDNITHTGITIANVQTMLQELLIEYRRLWNQKVLLQSNTDALTTITDVRNFVYDTNW